MKNKDTKNQAGKLSTPAVDSDMDSGVNSGSKKWDHSSGATKSGTGTERTQGDQGRQDRKNVDIETEDGYEDSSSKRKFSTSESESEVGSEGYSSPSESTEEQSFSEDESGISEQRRSSSLDKDEEEEQ